MVVAPPIYIFFDVLTLAGISPGFEYSWMPAITVGAHMKWNEGQTRLDDALGGLLDTLDSDHSRGVEFTVVASKIVLQYISAFAGDIDTNHAEHKDHTDY